MTGLVKGSKRHRHRVIFKRREAALPSHDPNVKDFSSHPGDAKSKRGPKTAETGTKIFETRVTGFGNRTTLESGIRAPSTMIPDLFTSPPFLQDSLVTESSSIQAETVEECLPFLSAIDANIPHNKYGVPRLDRERHIKFLHKSLGDLPAHFSGYDASRPWLFYWCLTGLATLGEDIQTYRERLIATVRPIQNEAGGFGGGNGQTSHIAPTYAITLCLVLMGGRECLDIIDRKSMWNWLGSLKQPDGGFTMSVGGEVDARGVFCALILITLLNLPLELPKDSPAALQGCETFLSNLPEWVARCQTHEGGISGSPDAKEAHGSYTYVGLAALCIIDDPHVIIPKYLNIPLLVSFLSSRQYAPEGGFSGRTNKLVDGCYSHWVGNSFPLIEACLNGPSLSVPSEEGPKIAPVSSVGHLYSTEGLLRYILCCCQDQSNRGGLRDKPSHTSDAYHTLYVLAGLGAAQNTWHVNTSATKAVQPGTLTAAYQWTSEPLVERGQIYEDSDRVNTLHPLFVLPEGCGEAAKAYFATKEEL